ncbi:unnamed protein product [Agarophyton chilense]
MPSLSTSFHLHSELEHLFQNPAASFGRGVFKRIVAERLSLPPPRDPPSPHLANTWMLWVDKDTLAVFSKTNPDGFHETLRSKLRLSLNANTTEPLPTPVLHATKPHYAKLLRRADSSGMLRWSVVEHEDPENFELADMLEMTLFWVTKSLKEDRLTSWPRVQNALLPDPPHKPLPDPSIFNRITTGSKNLSGFYLDIQNIFHNITLPSDLSLLFPMPKISLFALPSGLHSKLRERVSISSTNTNILLRP